MPIFYQQREINTRLGIWLIEEGEELFRNIPLQREISHPHKRLQHLGGRYLLQQLFPEFPLELIQIADTRKPFLQKEDFHFSVSHCDDYAAAIVSKTHRVGIDIEVFTEKVARIKNKFLHPDELEYFSAHEKDAITALTLLWSCKEAVFKWWSFGAVDFSEDIRIEPFSIAEEGLVQASFRGQPLTIYYKLFPLFALAYVVEDGSR